MRMDLSAPLELLDLELASFSDGRRQAYLTFQCESDIPITGFSGQLVMYGEDGRMTRPRQLRFKGLNAQPGEPFTCPLKADDFPEFVSYAFSPEWVSFPEGDPWQYDADRQVDVEIDPVTEKERIALIAIAGQDAICYAQKKDALWVCVCGRHNRFRWSRCRRCGRERDHTLASFAPGTALDTYQAHLDTEWQEAAKERRKEAAHAQEIQRQEALALKARTRRARVREGLLAVALAAGLIVMIAIGAQKLAEPLNKVAAQQASAQSDYLDSI